MTRNVRYQIFVSSTYTDLIPARRQVTEHILSMNHIPAGMEMFSASGKKQWETIQKAIDNSDYYVLIVGERYGSLSPEDGISYTEKEFNYALSRNIPTLCFLPGNHYATSRDHRETDPELIAKLNAFKKRLKEQLCDFWETADELVSKVSAALYKIFTEEPGTGWIRGNAADPDVLTKLVSAMEEKQRLLSRIQHLEQQARSELPALSLHINGHDFDTGPLMFVLPEPDKLVRYEPDLCREDIPDHLSTHISDESLEEFNASKPTQAQVDEHNDSLRFHQAAVEGKLDFAIRNKGPVKANNVTIRIAVPDGIRMIREDKLDELVKPELIIPSHPLIAAGIKHQTQLMDENIKNFFSHSERIEALLKNSSGIPPYSSLSLLNSLKFNGHHDHLYIQENGSVSGSRDAVRQTTIERLISEICLAPLRRGQFSLSVEILCDEYRGWQQSTLDIIIV